MSETKGNSQYQNTNVLSHFSLRRTRAKVWERRMSSSLFNVKKYVSGLEDVCHKMYERHARGEEPDHVTELSNF